MLACMHLDLGLLLNMARSLLSASHHAHVFMVAGYPFLYSSFDDADAADLFAQTHLQVFHTHAARCQSQPSKAGKTCSRAITDVVVCHGVVTR